MVIKDTAKMRLKVVPLTDDILPLPRDYASEVKDAS